jgi:hypothetical protein
MHISKNKIQILISGTRSIRYVLIEKITKLWKKTTTYLVQLNFKTFMTDGEFGIILPMLMTQTDQRKLCLIITIPTNRSIICLVRDVTLQAQTPIYYAVISPYQYRQSTDKGRSLLHLLQYNYSYENVFSMNKELN